MAKIDTLDIRRMAFSLSETAPLRATVNEEQRASRPLYDMHFELELGLVLEGRMERRFDRFRYVAQAGQVWLCGIWEPHGYRVTSPRSCALVIVIRPEMLAQMHFAEAPRRNWLAPFTAPPRRRPQVAGAADRQSLLAWAQRFQQTFSETGDQAALRQRLLLIEVLLTLTRTWQPAAASDAHAGDYARISKAVERVFAERGMISAVAAAHSCGLSRNQFDRLFQRLTSLSFGRFALRYRLGNAAGQLVHSDDALKKIATDWGFTDASHLVHGFKKHYGCTPLEYRRRKQADSATRNPPPPPAGQAAWNARLPAPP